MRPEEYYEHLDRVKELWIEALHEYGMYTQEMDIHVYNYLDLTEDCDYYEDLSNPEDQWFDMSLGILDNVDWVDDILDEED